MPYADLPRARLFFQQMGTGPDMVMIHGLAANHAFWFNRIGFSLKNRFRLTLLDLRGHGRSTMPPCGYTSLDMAHDVEQVLDRLGIAKVVLVGHSFGGNVALQYAALHPDRVAALVVADTRIYALQAAQRLGDSPLNSIEEELLQGAGIDADCEEHIGLRLLEEWVSQRRDDAPALPGAALVPFGRDSLQSRAAQRWLELVRNTSARDDFRAEAGLTRERIGNLTLPVLALYGRRSRCLPSGVALASLLANCTLRSVPGAGHFHPLSRPGYFLRAIAIFFGRLSRAATPAKDGPIVTGGARAGGTIRRSSLGLDA